jgi:uncharacterized protein involved in exopolysaccharide biosynthesis
MNKGMRGLSQAILQAWQQNDSRVLVRETTNNQSVVQEAETNTTKAIAGKKSFWLVGIIIGLAIAIAIALFGYVQSRRQVKPVKQSQTSTLCINCTER